MLTSCPIPLSPLFPISLLPQSLLWLLSSPLYRGSPDLPSVLKPPPLIFVTSSSVSRPIHLEALIPFQTQSFWKWNAAPSFSGTAEVLPSQKYIWGLFLPYEQRGKIYISGMRLFLTIINVQSRPDAHAWWKCICPHHLQGIPRGCLRTLAASWPLLMWKESYSMCVTVKWWAAYPVEKFLQ